jgi:hypothetical protein
MPSLLSDCNRSIFETVPDSKNAKGASRFQQETPRAN